MAAHATVELAVDCEHCGLEGGVVEVYDARAPACRFGLPATTRCKLCAATSEGVFDRAPPRPMREIAANRCPACLGELSPTAIDERRCAGCGARAALNETNPPTRFASLIELERALDAWAERESFPNRDALAAATFVEPSIDDLFVALSRRQRIEILADPFANMGLRTTGGGATREGDAPRPRETPQPRPPAAVPGSTRGMESARPPALVAASASPIAASPLAGPAAQLPVVLAESRRRPADVTPEPADQVQDTSGVWPPAPPSRRPMVEDVSPAAFAATDPVASPLGRPPPSAPPRAIVYPLVSVVTADGEVHPEERALVDRFLQSEGLAPLADHEYRFHHPSEVAHLVPRERREEVVKLMCETAAADGMPDESERRVIRAYATAWEVDDEKLEFWMWGYENMNTSLARGLWLKLRRFVLSARWSEPESRG